MAWYEDLFAGEDPARLDLYEETEHSRSQVTFVIEKLGLQPGARILDLCCGQGRHLIDMVRRGYDAVGVDLSEYMLGKCRQAAAREGIEPQLVRADMRQIRFDSEFDAVINLFVSFGYLESDEEDQKVLCAVARSLKPGGRFFVHVLNRDAVMKTWERESHRWWEENVRGEVTVYLDSILSPLTGRYDTTQVTIHADGHRTERHHSMRIYTYNELERMLGAAGLTVESVYGGYDGSELTIDSRAMIVIARKPAM